MRQCWLAPDLVSQPQKVFVESRFAPTSSPAPPGNAIVPAGYIKQIGSDGYEDTRFLIDKRSNPAGVPIPYIDQFVVPYFTGGWPPDPLSGIPGHTPQRPTGEG